MRAQRAGARMFGRRFAPVAAASLLFVGAGSAQEMCPELSDQDDVKSFSTPLLNDDQRSLFLGNLQYSCNSTSGGVTYKQNLSYVFDYSQNATAGKPNAGALTNDSFRLDLSTPPAPIPACSPSRRAPARPVSPCRCAGRVSPFVPIRCGCTDKLRTADITGMAANGCAGSKGINFNWTIMVRYPTKVWNALLQIDTLWPKPPMTAPIDQVQVVSNSTVTKEMDPVISAANLICPDVAKGWDKATCGTRNYNISNMLLETGTNVELTIKNAEGSSKSKEYGDAAYPPGLAFQMQSTFSVLSSAASKLCAGEKPFCCADPETQGGCCCTPDEMKPQCHNGQVPFIAGTCSAATGEGVVCSDHEDDDSKPSDGKNKPQKSNCEIFKTGIYNFTRSNAGTGGRVNVFPSLSDGVSLATAHPELGLQRAASSAATATLAVDEPLLGSGSGAVAAGTISFDLLQYIYAELCSTEIGNRRDTADCPGCKHGSCWLFGDGSTAAVDGKGYVKIGKYQNCDDVYHQFLRKFGAWGVAGIIVLIVAILAAGGFAGFQHYKKRQEQQAYGVSVNDDSIYKDVAGPGPGVAAAQDTRLEASEAALSGSDAASVVR